MNITEIIAKENPSVEEVIYVVTNYIFDKKKVTVTIDYHPIHFPLLMAAYQIAKQNYESNSI